MFQNDFTWEAAKFTNICDHVICFKDTDGNLNTFPTSKYRVRIILLLVCLCVNVCVSACNCMCQVSLEFSPSSAVPGEETTLQVTAQPDSLCGVSVVDQSVLIKEPGKTLDKDKVTSGTDGLFIILLIV